MTVVRWNPTRELASMEVDRLNRMFDEFYGGVRAWVPAVDIYETENELVLKADLPEVDLNDIDVRVENQTLTIAGERPDDFRVQLVAPFLQLQGASPRICLAARADLLEQLEHGEQPRFGSHERAIGESAEPGNGFLGGRCQIEVRFVRARRIKFAQPTFVVGSPVVEIVERRFRKCFGAELFAQRE